MRSTQQLGPIGGAIFGLLFAVVGYFVAFTLGKPMLDNAKASNHWPSVSGVITRSAVASNRSKSKTTYGFDVEYRYNVEGQEILYDNVFFGGNSSSSDSSAAHAVVGRYPVGAKVKVHYDPQNPANAVLEPGAHWQSYVLYGIGLAFLVAGVMTFGGSLFYVFAAGAILSGAAVGWLGSSSKRKSSDAFAPEFPSNQFSHPAPHPAEVKEGDGFNIH